MYVLEVGSGSIAAVSTFIGLTDMLVNGVSGANVAPVSVTVGVVTGLCAMITAHFARS